MKKLILVFCLMISADKAVAQEDKRIFYEGKLSFLVIEEGGVISIDRPIGKDVIVTYDNYFKSYMVAYKDHAGSVHSIFI